MTQPPLSVAIRQLEEELEVQLIERTTRSVKLTPAGEVLQEKAQEILASIEHARTLVRRIGQGMAGSLAVGFIGITTSLGLPDWIRRFRSEVPDVLLDLHEAPSGPLIRRLCQGSLDVAFLRGIPPDPLDYLLVASEGYWLALPEDHELTKRETIPLTALAETPLIFFPRQFAPAQYDEWITAFRTAGVTPNIVQEIHSLATEMALVSAGVGVALVTESITGQERPGVVYRQLEGEVPKVDVHVAWHPDRGSDLVQRFLEFCT